MPEKERQVPENEGMPEESECDHCGTLCDGRYCSSACRRAAESDRA
jgi:hypothetical protein